MKNFVPLESTPELEKSGPIREAYKGAFSEGARDALALAVSEHKRTVVMDRRTMNIRYYSERVFVQPQGAGLPCGSFSKEELARRISD